MQSYIFLFFTLCNIVVAVDENLVDYYVELINNETEKAETYQLPEDASQYRPNFTETKRYGVYDFIIIGCGSAGSVIARRLSENKRWRILVLEAGSYENDFVDIPGMYDYAQQTSYNWNFRTVPQKTACLGMINQQCAIPRGKGLGGSTIINGLIYSRGNKLDFDKWAADGNPGWAYEDVLPYFKKSENSSIDNADPGYHGKGGPLSVEYSHGYTQELYAFLDANNDLGRPTLDYNGKNELGVSKSQQVTLNGRRVSAARAFLFPTLNRCNLRVSTYSYVTRILIDRNKRARGVEFIKNGTKYKAFVKKEIILSAGSISSPQILMLSGIGPQKQLAKHNISIIQDLPVGKNLLDHVLFFAFQVKTNGSEPIRSLRQNVLNYLNNIGPFSFHYQGLGFFQTNLTNVIEFPDIEFLIGISNYSDPIFQKNFRLRNESAVALESNITKTLVMNIILLHPVSRGTVELKSSDPFDYPLIDPQLLANNKDIETVYQGILLGLQMLETEGFKKINATLVKVVHPNCSSFEYLSKEYWYCTIRHYTATVYHPVSTCKMGPNPRDSVVDDQLRVYGIKGLRVADASVIPLGISGHTNAAAIMIGERVSDFIKKE